MPITRVFTVDGAPFFPLGGQVHNSSAYRAEELERAWRALELMHANTAEIPVYWEQVEPEEGRFDFASVDMLLAGARARGLRLVLLWFGTWKNGAMNYAPAWVKGDPRRFRRVAAPGGATVGVLSSHCEDTLEADRRAFAALMRHLRDHDAADRTVIAVQVENEPGILGSDRDYGAEAEREFGAPVPDGLVDVIAGGSGAAHDAWQAQGAPRAGSWPEVFGTLAGELLTAYSIARYVDRIAAAGKQVYDIPLYANVWLAEQGWRTPGLTYPSGGPTLGALDIWRWAAPHLDLLAPDIYIEQHSEYRAICAGYARPDNPLFIPESMPGGANPQNMFYAIADHGAIGYAAFGIESLLDAQGQPKPEAQALLDSFRCAAAAIPLILAHQGSERLRAVVQEEHQYAHPLVLGDYEALAVFGDGGQFVWRDFRHPRGDAPERGRGLIVQTGPREFFLCGAGFRALFRRRQAPRDLLLSPALISDQFLLSRVAATVLVEEGRFEGGAWLATRRRNGDETDHGIWVAPDVGLVRVVLDEGLEA